MPRWPADRARRAARRRRDRRAPAGRGDRPGARPAGLSRLGGRVHRPGAGALRGGAVTPPLEHRFDGPEDAPVVMLSNSLGTSLEVWDDEIPALAGPFRVLRYDHRGHGGSPVPPGPYAIAELARDALELLDRLGVARVAFCGTSLGGMVGMWLAIEAPERVDRLALCCTSAHLPPREGWIERAATVRAHGMEAVADAALERWFTPGYAGRRPEAVERARRALLDTPAEGYAGCCEAIAECDLRGELRRIRAPTLVIAAEDDPATPPEHARLIAEAIDGARLVVLARARHLASVERAEAVSDELLAHLVAGTPA
ncbi:MAG: 3-oxoadipate enol-lactonase [Solirubrobacterales bacterium]|nr:3-oxoadipate enol-lactonase [Solirubrobacterales bacterium]